MLEKGTWTRLINRISQRRESVSSAVGCQWPAWLRCSLGSMKTNLQAQAESELRWVFPLDQGTTLIIVIALVLLIVAVVLVRRRRKAEG